MNNASPRFHHDVVNLGTDFHGILGETARTSKTDSHRDERQTSHADFLTDGVSFCAEWLVKRA
jgi:hypothetical protein